MNVSYHCVDLKKFLWAISLLPNSKWLYFFNLSFLCIPKNPQSSYLVQKSNLKQYMCCFFSGSFKNERFFFSVHKIKQHPRLKDFTGSLKASMHL